MQFLVIAYDGTDDKAPERRMAAREADLAGIVKMKEEGKAIYGAAILNDREQMIGSALVVDFPTRGDVDAWLKSEPYVVGAQSGANSARVPPMVFEMVAKLEQRLQDSPNDADGWARLGRAYAVMERTDDALAAYERAYALAPDNATVLADYAWLLFNRDPGQTTGRVSELYVRLYRLDAQNPDALWFLGFAAYQQGEFRKATGFWERLLKLLPPEDPGREHLQQTIASARAKTDVRALRRGRPRTGTGRIAARFLWQRNWLRTLPVACHNNGVYVLQENELSCNSPSAC